jgi:hypothetical protein
MFRALSCLVAVLTLGGARPALAQATPAQPARDTPTAAAGGTAVVRGRVVEAATGRGLSRVQVRANTNTSGPPPVPYPWAAMTDADGRYEINGIPAGTYGIAATKPNYVRAAFGAERVEGPGKRMTLTDGQVLDKIDIRLVRAGVITGRVVDEFGDPVTDVQVAPMRYQFIQGARRLMQTGRGGTTNDIGEFRIYGLSPGQYYVSATLRNFSMGPQDTANDRTGYAPTYYPGTGNVAEAQRLTMAQGQTVSAINLTLLPIQTARVSGIVVDAQGRPMSGVGVNAIQGFGGGGFLGAQTSPDGRFTISGLTPGEYTIRANLMGGQEQAAQALRIDGSDVTDLQLMVTKPSTIRGRIAFEAGGTPPKASTIRVTAMRADSVVIGGGGNVTVKDDLTFEMPISPGRVFVRSPPPSPNWRLNRVLLNGIDVTDIGVDIPVNGSVNNVVVELTDHLYPISGKVTDGNGALVRDCFVIVFAQNPASWTPGTRYLASVRPGLDDLFHSRMPAGDYYAIAMTDVEPGAWTDPDFLMQAREHATRFSIAEGDAKTVDLPLSPAPVF